jgi:hypothetical protein
MDFTSLYSTRIQETFDDDQSRILKTIKGRSASAEASKVSLINYYKGLPIMYGATILGVDGWNLDLDVHPQQAVAIAEGRYTLLRSKLFPLAVVARAQYVNVKKHIVSLNKLGFVEILAEKRRAVRLELDPPAPIIAQIGDLITRGTLVDISTQGVGMTADTFISIETGPGQLLKFMLPEPATLKETLLVVPGSLVDITGDAAPYKYKFRISPNKHHEHLISRYSFQRQVEIIRSLKERAE